MMGLGAGPILSRNRINLWRENLPFPNPKSRPTRRRHFCDTMALPPEITDLFASLASRLQNLGQENSDEEDVELSSSLELEMSKLNRSLNLGENSRVSVLDAALSLMCFKAPQVFDATIEYLVKTIVCVLSSSISCKVLRCRNEETLQIGSSILSRSSVEFLEISKDIIEKLGENGKPATLLLQAVVRLVASTSCYEQMFPHGLISHAKSVEGRGASVSKLLAYLPRQLPLEKHEIPLRLLFWYLEPLSLKDDVSRILRDAMSRPFLCLNKELFERTDWRNVVTCLALSPFMFIETRALLHQWFLLTGLASVLEFLVSLVSAILDIISRPSWWCIPMELALVLPFYDAYFPCRPKVLRILTGPLSCEALVLLVQAVNEPFVNAREQQSGTECKPARIKIQIIDHKSDWALAVSFPDWFYFASTLLFSKGNLQENFHLRRTSGAASNNSQSRNVEGLSTAAARYIAWILHPASRNIQDSLVDCLIRVSEIWASKPFGSEAHFKRTMIGNRKKRQSPILGNNEDSIFLEHLLGEFHDRINPVFDGSTAHRAHISLSLGLQNSFLVRRVVLGVLISSPYSVTNDGCELLLHYAVTGKILASNKTRSTGLKRAKRNSEISALRSEELMSKEESLEGTRLVFGLTDIVESMSVSIFETEGNSQEFILEVKLRSISYLVKCINRLIQLQDKEEGNSTLNDINIRLIHWRSQGREEPQISRDLEDVIANLSCKLSSP